MPEPYRVLFVCWGNICRSPAAECVFNHQLRAAGLEASVHCDYCEIGQTGEVPDPYYGGDDGFERVLDLLEEGAANLITRLRSEMNGN